jgi:urease accessory protein
MMAAMFLSQNHCRNWFARLELEFAARNKTTILFKNRHTGPLRLQRPFYPEDDVCHAYILHPPGGVVGGDHLELSTIVESKAAALLTTPGAAKFYRSVGDQAIQKNYFKVENGGCLEWLPQETIFFPAANAQTITKIDLAEKADFAGWEILCFGLPACGQPFHFGSSKTRLEIRRNGSLLLLDQLRVMGETELKRPSGLRGYSVSATFIAANGQKEMLAPLRKIAEKISDGLAGITLIEDLIVARYLGDSSLTAKNLFQKLWTWLRPQLTGRKACPPRIWAT